jgi:hypothetical protein
MMIISLIMYHNKMMNKMMNIMKIYNLFKNIRNNHIKSYINTLIFIWTVGGLFIINWFYMLYIMLVNIHKDVKCYGYN